MKNKIIQKIKENNKIALFQHVNPDGDSVSSSVGLGMAIKEAFPDKEVVVVADYNYLVNSFKFLEFDKEMFVSSIDDSYLGIVGDVSIGARIVNYDELKKAKEVVCFDHHQNPTDIDPEVFWHEPTYPASAIQAFEIAKEFKKEFSEDTSVMLMVGILTDTGFFKYSGANPKPLEIVSELFRSISDERMRTFHTSMSTKTKEDLAIQGYILQNVKYDKNVAYVIFDDEVVNKYGYLKLKIKVNLIGNIDGTKIWGFFIKDKDKEGNVIYPTELRSSSTTIVDIAKKYGGGGHNLACGATLKSLEEVKEMIKDLNNL